MRFPRFRMPTVWLPWWLALVVIPFWAAVVLVVYLLIAFGWLAWVLGRAAFQLSAFAVTRATIAVARARTA